jgi:hypothetical protein
VLADDFVADLHALTDDELRARRDDAHAEENEVSYVRRLLQGRIDLLRTATERRGRGEVLEPGRSDEELAAVLSRVLADPAQHGGGGSRYVDVTLPAPRRRRAAEVAADDVRLSDPASLGDADLQRAQELLEEQERQVSASRRRILRALDLLNAELQRRVEAGLISADR